MLKIFTAIVALSLATSVATPVWACRCERTSRLDKVGHRMLSRHGTLRTRLREAMQEVAEHMGKSVDTTNMLVHSGPGYTGAVASITDADDDTLLGFPHPNTAAALFYLRGFGTEERVLPTGFYVLEVTNDEVAGASARLVNGQGRVAVADVPIDIWDSNFTTLRKKSAAGDDEGPGIYFDFKLFGNRYRTCIGLRLGVSQK